MGKFANKEPGGDLRLGPTPSNEPWHGQSEFAALGHKVPMFRRSAADSHMKEMGFTDAEQRYDVISTMSDRIARDDPHDALEQALKKGVDATGCYRLLAVLLSEPETQEPETEATYLDLVG